MKLINLSANSHELRLDNFRSILFSYETPVAVDTGNGIYKTEAKFSKTTSKHINAWTATTRTASQAEIERMARVVLSS